MKQVKAKKKVKPGCSSIRRRFEEVKKANDEIVQHYQDEMVVLRDIVKLLEKCPEEHTVPNGKVVCYLEELIFDKERIIENLQADIERMEEALNQSEYEARVYENIAEVLKNAGRKPSGV